MKIWDGSALSVACVGGLADVQCVVVQVKMVQTTVVHVQTANGQCKVYAHGVKDVAKMQDDDYEWREDEAGNHYYRLKDNPDSEWQLWADEQSQTRHNESPDLEMASKETTHEPVVYCENMNWNTLNEKVKKLKPNCNLLRINVDENILSYLSAASDNKKLIKKSRIEVFPNINAKKLQKLLDKNKYKNNNFINADDVLMFADDTTFPLRNGNKGIMVTTVGLFCSSGGRTGFLPWRIENSRVTGFYDEKGFLSRKIVAVLDTGESIELFESSDPDLKKNLVELSQFLTLFADAANHAYCIENGINFSSAFDETEDAPESDGDFGLNGDCPNCGSSMREASLTARGGKALLRGFANYARWEPRQVGASTSIVGNSGGFFDKRMADKSRVCDNCGYKF